MLRFSYILVLLLPFALVAIASEYDDDTTTSVETVQTTTNLFADSQRASQKQVPILLMFSAEYCAYCELVRREFLRPMLLSGDYEDRVLIRQVDYDGDDLVDFNGEKITIEAFTDRYNASLSPTVIFLDSTGKEIAKQIIGITTVDYYGGDLDDNIAFALAKIRTAQSSKIAAIQ